MMKLTRIRVEGWSQQIGHHTRLTRCYTNPGIEQIVWMYPHKVGTSLYKDRIHHPIKPGIQHLTRP